MNAYLRYPHLHGDLVVFTAADDVWLAPLEGGRSWRLTDDRSPVSWPRFSPDGAKVAWISTRDGHREVMVIDTDGGPSERLTWFGASRATLLGWADAERVLVATPAFEGSLSRPMVYAVSLDGAFERLGYGPASGVALHPDGAVVLSTPWSRPPAHWKRYRGGTASRLWLDSKGDGHWRRLLPEITAGLTGPTWVGDRLVFASDHAATFPDRVDEQANLWALDVLGAGELTQLTRHTTEQGYVRDPAGDGERIVYHSRGVLYLVDDLAGGGERAGGLRRRDRRRRRATGLGARPIDITLGGALAPRQRRSLKPEDNLGAIRPDHGANASLVEWRGKAFYLAHREGPARLLAGDSGVRARDAHVLGKTGQAIVVTDTDGPDRIEILSLTGTEAPAVVNGDVGRVLHLAANPAGDIVIAISHDGRVRVIDVAQRTMGDLTHCEHGEASDVTFSPDGRYAAWSQPTWMGSFHQLVGVDLGARKRDVVALTSGQFDDTSPSFSRDGRHLLLLSARTFDPTYDSHSFDLSFTSAIRPYLIPLAASEPAPFGPSADGWRISADEPASASTAAEAAEPSAAGAGGDRVAPPASPDWDLDGFEERIVAFPVPSGNYRSLNAAKDAVVWIHEAADRGAIGTARAGVAEEPADVVESFSFTKRKLDVLVDKADAFSASGDGERIVVRDGTTVTVRPVDHPLKPDDPDLVTVDLDRLRFQLDPPAEWRQMFAETTRLMAQHYWREDMNGVDWPATLDRYRPALELVSSHDDLVDLLWEVVGELNSSHAYVNPENEPGDLSRRLGRLGADLSPAGEGWRIDRILPGESSDPHARSPLRAAGVGAAEGDLIVAVGGVPVDSRFGPAPLLIGAADQPIELTLRSTVRAAGRSGSRSSRATSRSPADRRVVVVPLADEATLRYQDWVRGRAAYVTDHGQGRIGYLHIPDMMGRGWAQLHRSLHRAAAHEAMIVDVRYNRGGHTSQLVLEKLIKRPIGWMLARHYTDDVPYPADSPRGPVVFVTNEHAGSDGDIVNAAAQIMGIGPVIGMRTWGGVIGIDMRFSLVDGTMVTQPRYASWFEGKEWGVENHGVDPDIEVETAPAERLSEAEQDRQLDVAIEEAIRRLTDHPAAVPPSLPPPRVH